MPFRYVERKSPRWNISSVAWLNAPSSTSKSGERPRARKKLSATAGTVSAASERVGIKASYRIIQARRLFPMSDPSQLNSPSMRSRVSPEEWRTRVALAACYRLVHHYRMDDLVYNHISARVPGEEGHFLLNAYGMTYDEITASSLVKVDFDGKIVQDSGTGYGINHAGFVIHSAIHRARHDLGCVIHTHTPAGMAVSALECGLLPLTQNAMFFGQIGYHDYEGPAID